jgi:two-component system, NtrC family, nitrogen regulation response regulator GlnG
VIRDGSTTLLPPKRGEPHSRRGFALTIAAHPDPARVGERLLLSAPGEARFERELARLTPTFTRADGAAGRPLDDPFISRQPIRLTGTAEGALRIDGAGSGTSFAVGELTAPQLELRVIGFGVPITLADRVVLVLHVVEASESETPGEPEAVRLAPPLDDMRLVGASSKVAAVRRAIAQVADLRVAVLLRGETGTGKELVARALHARSPRRHGPFVSLNLGAIPRELAASELFGAVRGAYTGASRDRRGFFLAASGGTLFLDEIGEASTELQAMLLRVLETGELYPVGASEPIATDVRLISATDANLEAQIQAGSFKAPLLHRLAGHEIHLPPLRERPEDIGPLFLHFVREALAVTDETAVLAPREGRAEPWLPAAIATRLVRFRWPGNVRQLRNVAQQLVVGSRGSRQLRIEPRLLAELDAGAMPAAAERPLAERTLADGSTPPPARREPVGTPAIAASAGPLGVEVTPGKSPLTALVRRRTAELEEPEVVAALRAHQWDLKAAADQLGIPRSSIYDVIERCPSIRTAGQLSLAEIERAYREHDGDLGLMAGQLEVSRRALQRRVKELGLHGERGKPEPEK